MRIASAVVLEKESCCSRRDGRKNCKIYFLEMLIMKEYCQWIQSYHGCHPVCNPRGIIRWGFVKRCLKNVCQKMLRRGPQCTIIYVSSEGEQRSYMQGWIQKRVTKKRWIDRLVERQVVDKRNIVTVKQTYIYNIYMLTVFIKTICANALKNCILGVIIEISHIFYIAKLSSSVWH